jgi:exodeoxyribonuclease VII small subunit
MVKDKSLEEVFEELDEVVGKLEESTISLEDSFSLYHKGMELLKACNDKIDKVEKKMLILDENGEQHEL